jgi:hypothetical protein
MDTLKQQLTSLLQFRPLWQAAFVVSVLAIGFLATTDSPHAIPSSSNDKVNHLIAFLELTILTRLADSTGRTRTAIASSLALLTISAWGTWLARSAVNTGCTILASIAWKALGAGDSALGTLALVASHTGLTSITSGALDTVLAPITGLAINTVWSTGALVTVVGIGTSLALGALSTVDAIRTCPALEALLAILGILTGSALVTPLSVWQGIETRGTDWTNVTAEALLALLAAWPRHTLGTWVAVLGSSTLVTINGS